MSGQKFVRNVYYHELVRSLQSVRLSRCKIIRAVILRLRACPKELIETFFQTSPTRLTKRPRNFWNANRTRPSQNIKVIRANIAHKERARKIKDVGIIKLQSLWHQTTVMAKKAAIQSLDKQPFDPKIARNGTAEQAV